ncbi:MAG: rhodanese-like domain-containing protein [Actinobacteria bacterium]|nr:rhodanese-like domain-containing protein [Actinomycetota bacterium]
MLATTLKSLSFENAARLAREGAAFVDLRPTGDYLEVHIPGSLHLLYEFGPGMASRARDCLPLDVPLMLIEEQGVDMKNAASALRGKGFTVLGSVPDAVGRWAEAEGTPASTEVIERGSGLELEMIDVGDPGANPPQGSRKISIERLWTLAGELSGQESVAIATGYGVRASLAVGMLERAGVREVLFVKTRAVPRTTPKLEPYG